MKRLLIFLPVLSLVLMLATVLPHRDDTARAAFPGADNLNVIAQNCLPDGTVQVTFAWTTYSQGSQQWIDLSLANNGFFPGTFIGAGPFGTSENTFAWSGLVRGQTHFARVNTLTALGWIPSNTLSFVTRGDCFPTGQMFGATNFRVVSQGCLSDGTISLNVAWTPSGQGSQWIDLTLFNNGFAPNTFVGGGPYDPTMSSLTWDGLLGGRIHYMRVNTLVGNIWAPSQTLSFFTRNDCTPTPVTPTPTPTTAPAATPTVTPAPPTATPTATGTPTM